DHSVAAAPATASDAATTDQSPTSPVRNKLHAISNAGGEGASASTPSRDSQEGRTWLTARHARSGPPRGNGEGSRPPGRRARAAATAVSRKARSGASPASAASDSQIRSPYPAPDAVVKTMTE